MQNGKRSLYKHNGLKKGSMAKEDLKDVAGGICLAVIGYCFVWLVFAAF